MDKSGSVYVSIGVGFAQVTDNTTFKLGDLMPGTGGWNYSSDVLQVLNTTAAKVTAMYSYFGDWEGATDDDRGWYEVTDDEVAADDVEFPVGTAFLGNFGAKDVNIRQAGGVLSGATSLDYTGSVYVMFGNPLPTSMTLGDIVPAASSWNYSSDVLQVLNATAAKVVGMYSYYGTWEGATDEDKGWYEVTDDEVSSDDVIVNPGDAWLGNFGAKDVVLVFPPAVE